LTAYYNEIDPKAAAWLRELIKAGHIAPGDVDERSIVDIRPADLVGYTQCHFFAGIGVWSHALRRAGWPDNRPVWSGSCPCQPFSAAGKGDGFADERHLWPHFHWLIQNCRPTVVFGEQVASKDGLGWLDLVQADLEGSGYASGAVDTCAAGFGAPHIRQRLYWVAYSDNAGSQGWKQPGCERTLERTSGAGGLVGGVADSPGIGRIARGNGDNGKHDRQQFAPDGSNGRPSPTNGLWSDADWLFCRDGKWRPVEPGTFPLAHGAAARVGRLRGYGNAIVAPAAQAFVEAYLETELVAANDNQCNGPLHLSA
jgi:DNA (cytosine-5)-methyltransferase 1